MSAFTRATLAVATTLLAACSGGTSNEPQLNKRADYIKGTISSTTYNGTTNDLLTAGLGKAGLAGACPAPASPTVEELRTVAICNNYQALVDVSANGGYGTIYGPNVDTNGTVTTGDGKIAGEEHIAFADDGSGTQNVTLMVQIPATFSAANPCIVSAASSGSRGVYGAIGTAGEWGLKRGCAVAYADKGTGNGAHDLAADMVNDLRGNRVAAATAGTGAQFKANLSGTDFAAFNTVFPNRWAFKHAHSQQNPEKDWGRDTLRAIQFAFYMLNQKFGDKVSDVTFVTFRASNTLVIASSVSNGAGAALLAAEQDTEGLIDGVAVAEPQIQVNAPASVAIKRGSITVGGGGKTLYDYFTIANLYEPCAALAAASAGAPAIAFVSAAAATNRCAALAANGLLTGATTAEQASESLSKMLANGWEVDAVPFMPSHYVFAVLPVALTYANAYAKASVKDNLCGYSFAATPVAGVPPALPAANAARIFGTGNGVPPTSGLVIVNNNSVGGAATDAASVSPSTGKADYNYDGAKCLRDLYTGTGAGSVALRANIDAVKGTGNLRGKPAVIVHGRSDTLVPVNHSSRPYYALNKTVDTASQLAYYEVTNAQHFDAFIDNAAFGSSAASPQGYDARLVPLHRYFIQAMDLVWNNLKSGAPLPPSQVVRTTPRGGTVGTVPALAASNVPPISAAPAASNLITFGGGTLTIPE